MTLAEDNFSVRPRWQGLTAPTSEKSSNPVPELRIIKGGNDASEAPDYADDIENAVDFVSVPSYITEINSSSSVNIDYMTSNIREYVKMSSDRRPKMVPVDAVVRGGSAIVSVISFMSLLATWLSGALIIQPIFALLLLLLSFGFYLMTLVKE